MRILYILLLVFTGCSKNNFKNLTLKEKGGIKNLLKYSFSTKEELYNFINELKLDSHKEEIEKIVELNKNNIITGKDIIFEAIKNDKIEILKAYYNYQESIFIFNISKVLINNLLEIICKNRSLVCLEFLINILNKQLEKECSINKDIINISKFISIILNNNLQDIQEYKTLEEERDCSLKAEEAIITNFIPEKPALGVRDITSIGLGIGIASIGSLKFNEEKYAKTALLVGGALFIGIPAYFYWKNSKEYNTEVSLKEEKLEITNNKLYLTKSNMEKIEKDIEEKEFLMVKCLVENFNAFINEDLIEKCEKVKKHKISEYLKTKIKTKIVRVKE